MSLAQGFKGADRWLQPESDGPPLSTPMFINRLVIASVFISLVWKVKYFALGFMIYFAHPLKDSFFPTILSNTFVSMGCYFLAMMSCILIISTRQTKVALGCGVALAVSLYILCIHQQTYNDVTFLTCFWTTIWSIWFTSRIDQDPESALHEKGVFLSHVVLSLIFLGGAVGKMTPGYWTGQVLYEIYFADRDFWFFNTLRETFADETLHFISGWYSRFVIGTELACSLLWLLPPRLASWLALVTCCGICIMSNVLLFSVLTCLIGLSLVGLVRSKINVAEPVGT
jgi:hypothetical protein